MSITPHEANLITEDRQKQAAVMKDHLELLGITVAVAYFDDDSSYPTEYTITYGAVQAKGATFNLALVSFIERLLPSTPTGEDEKVSIVPASSEPEEILEDEV